MKKKIEFFSKINHFDVNKQTRLQGDASKQGHRAEMKQLHFDDWKPISYASKTLNEAELKNSLNELKLLAVVWAVTH